MTRKEIYNRIEPLHMKMRFLHGAFLYDEDSHQGEQSLSVEDVKQYSNLELESINVFILELFAAGSEETAAKDEVTFKIIREAIEHRFPELTPGFHGERLYC